MILEDQIIKFICFTPSAFMRSSIQEKITEIQKEAPCGCHFNIVFTKKDHLLKGVITLHSSTGRFIAVARGGRLDILTIKLMSQIRKKIDKWKTPKFHKERRRDIFLNNKNLTMEAV